MEYKGYTIAITKGHGKNGKGLKKTTSVEVRERGYSGYFIKKRYTIKVGDKQQEQNAFEKAKEYIDNVLLKT